MAVFFTTPGAFRDWLEANAAGAPELLVCFHKISSGRPSMSWSESVDEALCFGWIDGVRKRIDDATYSIRFTPRKRDRSGVPSTSRRLRGFRPKGA